MLPSGPLDGLLCAFSSASGNNHFALATPDGRVRTFDTVTGRLRSGLAGKASGSGHLAEGYTCLSWLDSEAGSQRGGHGSSVARSWLALGTSSGAVKAYDSATGELIWKTADCNEGGVECLAFSAARSSVLLTSGHDGHVCSLNATTGTRQAAFRGSKHRVSAAVLSADGSKLLLGGSTLSLWDTDTQQRTAKFTGHPLPVRALAFAPSGGHALSAAEGERLVAVWATPGRGGGKKARAGGVAVASLAVEHPVVRLATTAAEGESTPGSFFVAATSEVGEVYVWLVVPRKGSDAGVDATQLARVAVGPGGAAAECVLAAALEPAPGGATLLAAVGTTATPRFERLHVSADGSGSSIVTHLQPAGAAAAIVRPSVGNADTGRSTARGVIPPAVLGPDNAGEPVLQRLPAGAARKRLAPEPDAAMTLAAAAGGGTPGVPADCVMSEEEEELGSGASTEPTLGQRLADLEQQAADTAAAAAADEVVAAATQQQQELLAPSQQQQLKQQQQRVLGSGGVAGTASLPPGPLKADSLSVLLTQALRSSDRALLEQCLAVGNERVIANTVRRLLPLDAALLLRAAVERLQSRPSRGQQLAAWIQAVLLHHTAYLMAAPGAAPVMSALYQTIEARLAVQRQLLGLTGRLELLLAQGGGGSGAGEPGGAAAAPGTALEYEETDSEAEVEVVDALQDALDGDSDGEYTDEEEEDEEDEGSEDEGGGTSEDG